MDKNRTASFREHFKNAEIITAEDIRAFLNKDKDIRKEIHYLKKQGVITSVKRGIYQLSEKKEFQPVPDARIKKINRLLKPNFPEVSHCIWSTEWLHPFMNLQPFRFFYILETEKDTVEPVFYLLKDNQINAFIQPDKDFTDKYIINSNKPVIVKPLISRSPSRTQEGIVMAAIEKILVDIYCEPDIFYAFQGKELRNIFNNAFRQYHINYSRLLNYYKRRKKDNSMVEYLLKNIENIPKNLLK
ncbi:MAG: hypothetical protein HPY80_01675 [Bacteroidales bacterium]|jgi:hypothetical protein|nr:hypothetical protein [Bacteroidales bacterium]NPV35358.1 hypothetical protein [Bacteroidales bacterium]